MAKKEKTSKVDAGSSGEALTAEEISEKYTVAELKYILRQNGLKVSGKKQDLVERVLPILNEDSQSTEKAEFIEAEEVVSAETEDSNSPDDVELINGELLSSALGVFGINYGDLDIQDRIIMEDNTKLFIQGFVQDGLSMSDSTISIVAASDSSNVDLEMNIPEVSYSDFESKIFTFKNLDLSILPSSDPQSLEFAAIMDSLEIITENNYVNLKGLDLLFKSFADENGVRLDININSFIYPDFDGTSINFDDIDLKISIGVDEQSLAISVNLPSLTLLNKDYKVNLSDLDLNILLPDTKVSCLDLSILLPDFHYTNFDDVVIDMDNVDVSLEPISDLNDINVNISMGGMDATGLNSLDELFPMLKITGVNLKNPADDSQSLIRLTGVMNLLDIFKYMDLSSIGALLSSGFDLDTYTSNMSGQYEGLDVDAEVSDFDSPGFDLGSIIANCDYSSLNAIELNLTGLLDSADIDLADFDIDVSDYDLSSIGLSDLIDALRNSDFVNAAIGGGSKLFGLDLGSIDLSGLIVSFDVEKFDISGLLNSLNLGDLDISGLLEMFAKSDVDLAGVFENCDYSCLDAIVLDLSGLLDSIGIDLADLGIDVSGYDLSAISLSDVIGILSNFDLDMSTLAAMLKLFGIDLEDINLSGLIASFDLENFDISSLLASIKLGDLDIPAIIAMFDESDVDLAGLFENCDYSCFSAIELNLTGLLDSAGIDLADFGIDVSDYDLSSIGLSDLIDAFSNSDFDWSEFDFSSFDLEAIDFSGLVDSFDVENFDMSSLLASLNLEDFDISALLDMFAESDIDLAGVFENCDYSCLDAIVLDLSGLLDSLGIDLADLGIDVSDYDLSAISLSDVIGILSSFDLDMSTLSAVLKIFGIDLKDLDFSGLVASFDVENFDMSALLGSIKIFDLDLSSIVEIFNNMDFDLAGVFENCDYSCLDAIVLDLSGLIDSLNIDLADFGIDVSDYDLSAISLSDVIDVLSNSEFINTAMGAVSKLFAIDMDSLDFSGLIASFDAENFDLSGLVESLQVAGLDISGILEMFTKNGFDLTEFMNNMLSPFMENAVAEAQDA